MTSPRLCLGAGAAFAAALLPALLVIPAGSAPVPPGNPIIQLTPAGETKVKVADLRVSDGAVIDETTVVVVGTKDDGPEDADPDKLDPNGAILDLTTKKTRRFTNGHAARITSVAAARGRIVTASTNKDPTIRVWDRSAGKTVATVEIEKPDGLKHHAVGCFHRSNKVAVTADERVVVLDPDRPGDRTEFACPPEVRWPLSDPIVVSPDDTRLACGTIRGGLVVWEVATRKAKVSSLLPKWADPDGSGWSVGALNFEPAGTLIASRCWSAKAEVPEKKAEADVPADRRGVVRIDLTTGGVEPLGMGQTIYTMYCAVDPTGTWLATVGSSRPDRPRPDGSKSVGELRVYHLPLRKLAYREQVEGLPLMWVAFTPGGKRLVSATYDGVVKWWDVAVGGTAPAQPSAKPSDK